MSRGQLVCITGIDGAGKSTLAKNVNSRLNDLGYRSAYVYGRYIPRILQPIMEFGNRLFFKETDFASNYSEHSESKQGFFSNRYIARAYEFAMIAEYLPQIYRRVVPLLYRNEFVICDRYLYDTLLVDLSPDVIRSPDEAVQRYRKYRHLVPCPDYEYFVEIPAEVAINRKNDIPSLEYITQREDYYSEFARAFDFETLDGVREPEDLTTIVVDNLTTKL